MKNSIQIKAADTLKAAHGYSASVVRLRNTSAVSIDYSVSGGSAVEIAAGASAVVDVAALTSEISVRRTDLSATPVDVILEFGLDPDEAYVLAVENAPGSIPSVSAADITDLASGRGPLLTGTQAEAREAIGVEGSADVSTHNAAADAHAAGLNELRFVGNASTWKLEGRGPSVAGNIAVPFFRSDRANTATALDVMPCGVPATLQIAWIDVCNEDLKAKADPENFACAMVAIQSDKTLFGSHHNGTKPNLPTCVGGSRVYFQSAAAGPNIDSYGMFDNSGLSVFKDNTQAGAVYIGNGGVIAMMTGGRMRFGDQSAANPNAQNNVCIGRASAGVLDVKTNYDTDPAAIKVSSVILAAPSTPASASAAGVTGTVVYDANYVYVCVATDTWKRSALSTW